MSVSLQSSSYHLVREKIIQLTVDLDDKKKIFKSIQRKIEAVRHSISRVEGDVEDEYNTIIENEGKSFNIEFENMSNLLNNLVSEKKELISKCQQSIDDIKEKESNSAAEVRKLIRDQDAVIEQDRRMFRAGQEDRLQKFLRDKASEYKESTERALHPEFERLKRMHERELSELERRVALDEKRMRDDISKKLTDQVEEEKEIIQKEHRRVMQSIESNLQMEMDSLEREHKYRLQALQDELEKESEKHRLSLQAQASKARAEMQREMKLVQEYIKAELADMKCRHEEEVQSLESHQIDKLKQMKSKFEESKAAIDLEIRESSAGASSPCASIAKKNAAGNTSERDRRIQAEIKTLQGESMRMEREMERATAEEKSKIAAIADREIQQLTHMQKDVSDNIAECMVQRDVLLKEVKSIDNEGVLTVINALNACNKELETYNTALAAVKVKIHEAEYSTQRRVHEEQRALQSKISNTRQRVEHCWNVLRQRQESLDKEMHDLEASHEAELEDIDRNIKEQVGVKEQEIALLKDAVHSEKIKITRIEKLLKQYSSASSAV